MIPNFGRFESRLHLEGISVHTAAHFFLHFNLDVFFFVIAVCKKLVKTQINTKLAHWGMKFARAISQELLNQLL